MSAMLQAAADYAFHGLSVFPCKEKKPLTKNGFKDASLEAKQIAAFWTRWPDAQIGVPTGQINRLFVIDIDGPEGERTAAGLNLPTTFTVETRPGRYQLWFRQPDGVTSKCTTAVLGPEIDTRGDGGYVIAPPSIHHETGKPYRVVVDRPWVTAPTELFEPPTKSGNGARPAEVSGPIPQGQRHATLLSLAGSLAKRALPDGVILSALRDVNEKLAKPPLNDTELVRMVQYVSDKKPPAAGSSIVLKCLNDVESRDISWLWPKRFPLGKLSIIAGDPGLGKSTVLLDFAARVTRGNDWPDGSQCPPGNVVLLSAEDSNEDTIKPRAEAAGADAKRIHTVQAVRLTKPSGDVSVKYFSLATDIPALESAVFSLGDVRLIIVDPISAYLGTIDSHKNSEVRSVLHPLADLASRAQAAVIAITHLNKKAGPALYRIVDSIAFMATARSAWLVARNCDKPSERLLLPGKSNLGPDGGGLGLRFTLKERAGTVVVEWGSATNVTPDATLGADSESSAERSTRLEAMEWLTSELEGGPQPVTVIREQARKNGFSWATVRRAKSKLSVRSYKISIAGGWAWELQLSSREQGE